MDKNAFQNHVIQSNALERDSYVNLNINSVPASQIGNNFTIPLPVNGTAIPTSQVPNLTTPSSVHGINFTRESGIFRRPRHGLSSVNGTAVRNTPVCRISTNLPRQSGFIQGSRHGLNSSAANMCADSNEATFNIPRYSIPSRLHESVLSSPYFRSNGRIPEYMQIPLRATSSNIAQFSTESNNLLFNSGHKRSAEPVENIMSYYVKKWHSTVRCDQGCTCRMFFDYLLHFRSCNVIHCDTCAQVQKLLSSIQFCEIAEDIKRSSSNDLTYISSSTGSFSSSEEMRPPSWCFTIEDVIRNPSVTQFPNLKQSPETLPLAGIHEPKHVNGDPIKDSVFIKETVEQSSSDEIEKPSKRPRIEDSVGPFSSWNEGLLVYQMQIERLPSLKEWLESSLVLGIQEPKHVVEKDSIVIKDTEAENALSLSEDLPSARTIKGPSIDDTSSGKQKHLDDSKLNTIATHPVRIEDSVGPLSSGNEESLVNQMQIERLPSLKEWLESSRVLGIQEPKHIVKKDSIVVKDTEAENGLSLFKDPPLARTIEDTNIGDTSSGKQKHLDDSKLNTIATLPVSSNADFEAEPPDKTTIYGKKLDNTEIKVVSLVDCWTEDQINNHISFLSQPQGVEWDRMKAKEQNACQLCGEDTLLLSSSPIYCLSCATRIREKRNYYSTKEEQNGVSHCICTACFKLLHGTTTICGITISKSKLIKKNNVNEREEPWVQCNKCEALQHQICALYNVKIDEGDSRYICPHCRLKEIDDNHRPLNSCDFLGAKELPKTMLSNFIEERLYRRLQEEREEKAMSAGKTIDEIPGAKDLAVRVVLSVDKSSRVKEEFLDIFRDESYPSEFLYNSKVVLLFQKIDGVDVCLFAMYVQEFGSECGQPNERCFYISYLDSVKYFRPERFTASGEALRSFVYHEILIGYLEYCKKQGFTTCYLWACPPPKGEDYILNGHPEIQKTPRPDKLRQWYHSLLRKAVEEKVVVSFTNLYDHFFVSTGQHNFKITAARLPYIDGAHWTTSAETILKMMEQETEAKCKRVMRKKTKTAIKAMGHSEISNTSAKDILLMEKLGHAIVSVKEDLIVVHMQYFCTTCHKMILSGSRWTCSQCKNLQLCDRCHDIENISSGEIDHHSLNNMDRHLLTKIPVDAVQSDTKDNDVMLQNKLLDERPTFLSFCQTNSYQFDTLRRAKHSSMMILHYFQEELKRH